MSLETCSEDGDQFVMLPHWPDWSTKPAWRRRWLPNVTTAITGATERLAMRDSGIVKLSWLVTPGSGEERALLLSRILAAKKSGLACAPYWGRGAQLTAPVEAGATLNIDSVRWPWKPGAPVWIGLDQRGLAEAWEVGEVETWDELGQLVLTGALTGSYPAGTWVYPILVGLVEVAELNAWDDTLGAVQVSIEQRRPWPRFITPLVIVTTELPTFTLGSEYDYQLEASGGVLPYAWELVSGTLPEGLSLTAAGVLSGTPTEVGEFTFTVRVTDAEDSTDTQVYTLLVSPSKLVLPYTTGLLWFVDFSDPAVVFTDAARTNPAVEDDQVLGVTDKATGAHLHHLAQFQSDPGPILVTLPNGLTVVNYPNDAYGGVRDLWAPNTATYPITTVRYYVVVASNDYDVSGFHFLIGGDDAGLHAGPDKELFSSVWAGKVSEVDINGVTVPKTTNRPTELSCIEVQTSNVSNCAHITQDRDGDYGERSWVGKYGLLLAYDHIPTGGNRALIRAAVMEHFGIT